MSVPEMTWKSWPSQLDHQLEDATIAYIGGDRAIWFDSIDRTIWFYHSITHAWHQKKPDTSCPYPSKRKEAGMAYLGGDRVLLFGGYEDDGTYPTDTWCYSIYDNKWQCLTDSEPPKPRRGHRMTYIGIDKVLMFGGMQAHPSTLMDDTWIFDLNQGSWCRDTFFGAWRVAKGLV
ncbi:Kelch repeat-containing protein, partial [Candidatus Entotheonella palauensis]|uniref:Kelch repeat-containing protein n=1 Tax=Candidatus Entotheonella palauensis TaxID=93172 RepID=UPI00211795CF